MANFEEFINDLITEVSYRTKEGIINLNNPTHIDILSEVLDEVGLGEIKTELFQNLFEAEENDQPNDDYEHLGAGVYVKKADVGREGAKKYTKRDDGSFQTISDDEYEKIKSQQGDSGEKAAAGSAQNQTQSNIGGDEQSNNEPERGSSLSPGSAGGDTYIDSLPDGDPAKVKTPSSTPSSTPLSRKEQKEIATKTYQESESRAKEIYGEDLSTPLLQDSRTSDELLNNGYTKGKYYTAPGNAGSAYNENISNEGVKILERYSDLSEEELAAILFRKTNGTKLGNQQKSTRVHSPTKKETGVVPNGLTKEEADLYRSAIIAARSAKSKYNRAKSAVEAAQSQVGFGSNVTMRAYGGTSRTTKGSGDAVTPDDVVTDLEALENEIQTANKCFIYDGETGKTYEIPKDVLSQWVQSSGGGENAADTAVTTKDENGNLLYDGWSDKKAFDDLQGNSTLNDDYNKQSSNLSKLKENGNVDSDTSSQAKMIIDGAQKKSSEIEADYKRAPKKEAQYFGTLFGEDKDRIVQHLKDQEDGYERAGTSNHIEKAMVKYGVSTHEELLDKLIDESRTGNPSNDRLKIINRAADAERAYIKSTDNEVPAGLDTNQILSDAREQALNLQKETMEKLNQLKGKTKSGKEKRVGDLLGFQETIDFLHIDKIEKPKDDSDYKTILKRNTQLVMAGVAVPPENLKGCLDVDGLTEYEDDFEVVTEEEFTKDRKTERYTTGKIVYIYALSKDGNEKKFVAKKVYRSKEGATGKTQNTIEWSNDMQKCFDSK